MTASQPGDSPGIGSSRSDTLRFVAGGGRRDRLRAATARPFLGLASFLLTFVARWMDSPALHRTERLMARVAGRIGGVRVECEGLDRIDPDEQYVVVPLHEGMADVLALQRLPLGLRYAVRDELFDWPGLGSYLTASRQVRVDSVGSVSAVRRFYRDAERVFIDGDSLVLFAQGSVLGIEVALRSGAVRLARRTGRPLLPVVLTGSHQVWEHPHSPTIRFGQRVSMRVLDPIRPDALDESAFRVLESRMKRLAMAGDLAPARRYRPEVDGFWDGYEFEIDPAFPVLRSQVAAHRASIADRS
jgi:1-acyl-sn-glycerol-3-phosphate acyltransferase